MSDKPLNTIEVLALFRDNGEINFIRLKEVIHTINMSIHAPYPSDGVSTYYKNINLLGVKEGLTDAISNIYKHLDEVKKCKEGGRMILDDLEEMLEDSYIEPDINTQSVKNAINFIQWYSISPNIGTLSLHQNGDALIIFRNNHSIMSLGFSNDGEVYWGYYNGKTKISDSGSFELYDPKRNHTMILFSHRLKYIKIRQLIRFFEGK